MFQYHSTIVENRHSIVGAVRFYMYLCQSGTHHNGKTILVREFPHSLDMYVNVVYTSPDPASGMVAFVSTVDGRTVGSVQMWAHATVGDMRALILQEHHVPLEAVDCRLHTQRTATYLSRYTMRQKQIKVFPRPPPLHALRDEPAPVEVVDLTD